MSCFQVPYADASTEEHAAAYIELTGGGTNSEETLARAETWLAQCEKHEFCSNWSSLNGISQTLPARLLEISPADHTPGVRIVHGKDIASNSRYATLSYCWGGLNPIMLRQSNLEEFMQRIPWPKLPSTFRDAIQITARLKLRYLWIDALCIVQDDSLDWATEAARMTNVYANSTLNIMADGGTNSEQGLFQNRNTDAERAILRRSRELGPKKDWICYADHFGRDIFGSPLNLSLIHI